MPMTFNARSPTFFRPHDVINLVTAAGRISAYTPATIEAFFGGVVPTVFGRNDYIIELLDPGIVNDLTDEAMGTLLAVSFTVGSFPGDLKFGIRSVVEGIEEQEVVVEDGAVTSDPGVLVIKVDEENFLGVETEGPNPGLIIGDYNGPTPFDLYVPPTDAEIQDQLDNITDPSSVYALAGVTIKWTNAVDGQTVPSPLKVAVRVFRALRNT